MSFYQPTGFKKLFHIARRRLAKTWLSMMKTRQIAVTGSQGKTITTLVLYRLFSSYGSTVSTDINLDTIYNVPITALKVKPWTKYIIWELGIDQPGEMDYHLEIARPSTAVITGISPVHTDDNHLGSIENLIKEKRKLIEILPKNGYAVLNWDDDNVRKMAPYTKAKILRYGTDKKHCDVYVDLKTIKISLEGTTFQLISTDFNRFQPISTALIGTHHIYTLMAAYCVIKSVQPKANLREKFIEVVKNIKPLRGRMNVEKGPLETILLNDSLRANPASTKSGLETFDRISYTKGRKIAVIGEMGELNHPVAEHQKIGRLLTGLSFSYVVCIGTLTKNIVDSALRHGFPPNKILYCDNVFDAAEKLKNLLKPGDLWYLKGSLLRNYKRIARLLNGKKVCCDRVLCPYEHCGYREK